jgi:hypothetical protein
MGRMYGKRSKANPTNAIRRYKIFHKKDPREIRAIRGLPEHFRELGRCISVMYETDKWNDDGDDTRYKHLHAGGVRAFEVVTNEGDDTVSLPVTPPTPEEGFARLGKCLGFFVKTKGGGVREYNPTGTDLFTSPSGNLLGVYDPTRGWVAFIAGGDLRVEAEGIDG